MFELKMMDVAMSIDPKPSPSRKPTLKRKGTSAYDFGRRRTEKYWRLRLATLAAGAPKSIGVAGLGMRVGTAHAPAGWECVCGCGLGMRVRLRVGADVERNRVKWISGCDMDNLVVERDDCGGLAGCESRW
jgi:hypothetical protein